MSKAALTVVVVLLLSLVAGCGNSDTSSTSTATTSASAAASGGRAVEHGTVSIVSFMYRPKTFVVHQGGSIVFDNRDNASHTATADDGDFDSGTLATGASKQVTFSRSGTFAYHCAFHPVMHGTVVVE